MPAQRPRASFEPIAPDFDLSALVESMENFQFVPRISCDMIDVQGMEAFDKLVHLHVVIGGKPLVVDGYQNRLDPWTFSSKWLQDNHGDKVENARNLSKKDIIPLTIAHYLRNMSKLTDQYFEKAGNFKEKDRQRVYLKDIDCPEVWQNKLREHLPPNLFYFNENTGEVAGPGSVDEPMPGGGKRRGRGIAPAGDLMSSLPLHMRAENIMCYIGHEGTYTPAHHEMCGSLGQNIMVETSDVLGEDGKPERPGTSIWFMTETSERHLVTEYWLSQLGHDIEVENHFAQIAAWKKAPFTTYVVEQKAGDFILIPPMAPHQVWNRGTRTMKVAWNRTTVEGLEMALKEALPSARLVCRDEQYKNKAIVYYTLEKYSGLLARVRDQEQTATSPQEAASLRTSPKIKQLQKEFKRLFNLFKGILLSEMFDPDHPHEKNVQSFPFESNITCAYCRGNIFNRFLTCTNCDYAPKTPEAEPYDICMECYAMGRSCGCISKLRWAEQFKWKELIHKYESWRRQYIEVDRGMKANPPLTIPEERAKLMERTLAQVCQDQLKKRPFVDISKPAEQPNAMLSDEEEIEVNDDGTIKKKRKRKPEALLKHTHACHVCCHRHDKWRMAECKCGRWWCYGALFRAHDLMPLDVMKDPNWTCPHCQGICGAGNCRKDPRQNPYKPQHTLLGHDTRKVADARSVESLVDFSVSNITWLNETSKEAPQNNARLAMRLEEAERVKAIDASVLDPYASDEDGNNEDGIHYDNDYVAIDPQLGGDVNNAMPNAANMFRSANGQHNGAYQPATQSGYVAPSAVLYRPPEEQDAEGDAEFPDNDDENDDDDSVAAKRARAAKERKKKQKVDEQGPISDATRQYRKEQERKALEEARKQGRFIQVHAAIKGKSKLIKLRLPRDDLVRITRAARTGGAVDDTNENILLRSDLAVQKPPPNSKTRASADKQEKASKQVRIRVEHDENFGDRRRNRKAVDAKGPKKVGQVDYEEVDIASDEGEEGAEGDTTLDGAVERTDTGGKKRRISLWQRKHADVNGDIPDELPTNESRRNRSRTSQKPTNEMRRPAGKSVPQIRPPHGFVGQIESDDENENDDDDEDEQMEDPMEEVRRNLMNTAAAAALEAEENARAKLAAAEIADGDFNAMEEDAIFVSSPVKAVASFAQQRDQSIMSRTGPGGRKVKIVSASRRQTTGGAQNTDNGGFVAANRAAMSSPAVK